MFDDRNIYYLKWHGRVLWAMFDGKAAVTIKCSEIITGHDVQMKVALYASETADPVLAVENQMNKHLLRYNRKLGGVPICFRDVSLVPGKEYGHFFNEHPHVHVDVQGKVLVFAPTTGTSVTGRITRVSENAVSILVLGLFNASISGAEMKKGFKYVAGSRSWESTSGDESWQQDSDVIFVVHSVQHGNGVMNISGRLP